MRLAPRFFKRNIEPGGPGMAVNEAQAWPAQRLAPPRCGPDVALAVLSEAGGAVR